MSKSSEAVKRWRKSAKNIILKCMGGCCQICNYDRCPSALELHHVDPQEKEISIGTIMARCRSWDFLYDEISKCILLCSNCHREVHAELVEIPEYYKRFSREDADLLRTKQSLATQHTNAEKTREGKADRIAKFKSGKRDFNGKRQQLVSSCDIDFTKHGAITDLARLLKISSTNTRKWLKRHMPEIYDVTPKA